MLALSGAPLGLLLGGRRREAAGAATLIMAAFYVCYSIFAFFPVAGPRYAFSILVEYPVTDGLKTHCWKPLQDEVCTLLAELAP